MLLPAANNGSWQQRISLNFYFLLAKPSLTELATLAKHLSVMLKSGLSITEALASVQDQARGRWRLVLGRVLTAVKEGSSLAEALGRWPQVFTHFFVSIIAAGEAAGRLDDNLEIIARHFKKQKELRAKIKSALFYPLLVLALAFFVGLGVAWLILPKITPLFQGLGIDLPWTTRLLVKAAGFFKHFGAWLLAALVLAVFGWAITRRYKFCQKINHWLWLHLPVLGPIAKKANLAMLSQTLTALLASGLTVKESLLNSREIVNNYYYQKNLTAAAKSIELGSSLSQALAKASWLYPRLVLNMVAVGERSGRLEESLNYVAELYEEEVAEAVKILARAIEPALLFGLGLLVAGLALAIITPMYKLTENVY